MWFKRQKPYSRTDILEAAGKAQSKGKLKKAIAKYQILLKVDPEDHEAHSKIAPLLARKRRFSESWESFKAAGEGYNSLGFSDKAMSVYTQATSYMPRKIGTWEALVELQLDLRLQADAFETLVNGQRYFRHCNNREKAISLLRKAWEIEPWHFEITFCLAYNLAKTDKRDEALNLLNGLAEREQGSNLRRTLGAQLRIVPSPTSAWRWLSASLTGTSKRSKGSSEVLMDGNPDSAGDVTDEKEVLPKKENPGDEALNTNESIRETVDFGDDEDLHGDTKHQEICRRAPAIISAGFASYDGSYAGTILNISETGAFIRYDQDLKPINYINVRLSLPEEKRVIEVKSEVIWAKRFDEKENLSQGMGIHFTGITPEDRESIASFVNKALHKDEQINKEQEESCGGLTRNHQEENITTWVG